MVASAEHSWLTIKLLNYRQIESLEEYVLVSQTEAMVEVYRRGAAGAWVSEVLKGDGAVRLTSVGLTLTLAEIYEDIILS